MSFRQKLEHEIKALALAALYFACWIGVLMALKRLVLAEYHIEFRGLSLALVGVLVLSKVVIVLEHVPLGTWVRSRPAWVDVALRTAVYAVGVFVVLLLEKGFEGRHQYGGFGPSLSAPFQDLDHYHVWATTICVTGGLLGYNVLAVVRRHVGDRKLIRMFLKPLPEKQPDSIATGPG